MIPRLKSLQSEYPAQFWTLFFGSLIFSAGNGLIFPFLSLYLTGQLGLSMTEAGILYVGVAVVAAGAQIIGGMLVDRIGRKPVLLFGVYGGILPAVLMGLAGDFFANTVGPVRMLILSVLVVLFGLTYGLYAPASGAMVADLVGSEKRTKAYGLLRVVQNIGIAIGPAIGGFIATRSYLVLFLCSGFGSLVYGLITTFFIRETLPSQPASKLLKTYKTPEEGGFGPVFADKIFLLFCSLYLVSMLVYNQMNTTLPVYLKEGFGVKEYEYGFLMSLNAAMVVVFQFPLSSWMSRFDKGKMMALGVLLFAVGFGMFAFVTSLPWFFLAQAIWTTGEMVTSPISQAFAADAAPSSMRGRYLGFFALTMGVASGIGPLLGGLVMDSLGGRFIWYFAILLNLFVMVSFILFNRRMKRAAGQNQAEALYESSI